MRPRPIVTLAPAVAVAVALVGAVVVSCSAPPPKPAGPVWAPSVVYPSEPTLTRGFLDVRGLVHSHSVYSHDACDGKPLLDDGTRDPVCFDDFRRGLCQSQHDFAFLTDHLDAFVETEFPDALLYREDRGDVLISHDGNMSANVITCEDGHKATIMAGNEGGMMPVGFEGHAVPADQRSDVYGAKTPEAAQVMREHGAVVLLAHPEQYTPDELMNLPVDGFEMYNLHANTLLGAGQALDLLLRWTQGDKEVPVSDLLILSIWSEDQRYLTRWGNVLARGKHVVTTMGTDCHRNTFTTVMEDGERADSYRRMMVAFSNHLRIKPHDDGSTDDRSLKEALAAGRNWGAFEMMGYPVGFDSFAQKDAQVFEMGDTAPVGATLVVDKPHVKDLNPAREAPAIVTRVLKATNDAAGFVEVAKSTDDHLEVPLTEPGAYRAEIRMLPNHLREDMREDAATLLDQKVFDGTDYVWVYGGAIYDE